MKKSSNKIALANFFLRVGSLRIVIADDEDAYFNEKMLSTARSAGFPNIERVNFVTNEVFQSWLDDNPDIIILDVKNVVAESVAKDGIELARTLARRTKSMIVITSAQQHVLRNALLDVDSFIEDKKLTSSDFIQELSRLTNEYIENKSRFYKNLFLKLGLKLASSAVGQ